MKIIRTSLGPGRGERNIEGPALPADLFVRLPKEIRLSPLLFEKLHGQLAPTPLLIRTLNRAD